MDEQKQILVQVRFKTIGGVVGEKVKIKCDRYDVWHERLRFFPKPFMIEDMMSDIADRSIALDQIAEYFVVEPPKMIDGPLDTDLENYLLNYGDLEIFYRGIAARNYVGLAFYSALKPLDKYLIVRENLLPSGISSITNNSVVEYEDPKLLKLMLALIEARSFIPDNHPLQKLAKKG